MDLPDRRVWVGEFVFLEKGFKGDPLHSMKDRKGAMKYAWVAGYDLDANEDLAGGPSPLPAAILSVRQKVQGIAFLEGHILLSMSYGRKDHSTLAVYKIHPGGKENPHDSAQVRGKAVPVWFLDGLNKIGQDIDFPPMSEGITAVKGRLGVIFESGAEKYKTAGHVPLNNIILLDPFSGK